jgi:hypothetical protein
MGKKSGSGSRIREEQHRPYLLELRNHFFGVKILKFFDADPGWIREREKSRILELEKHPRSEHCLYRIQNFPSRIPDLGSKRFRIPVPDPHKKNLSIFNPKNCF